MSIAEISTRLTDLSRAGQRSSADPHDSARYEQISVIASRLRRLQDEPMTNRGDRTRFTYLAARSPAVGADAAIFRSDGRLLLTERCDGKGWCMPGGIVEVGEQPWVTVVREVHEELCLDVRPVRLLAVYDNRRLRRDGNFHAIQHIYQCEIIGGAPSRTREVAAYGWFNVEEAGRLRIFSPHVTVIPEMFVQTTGTRFH